MKPFREPMTTAPSALAAARACGSAGAALFAQVTNVTKPTAPRPRALIKTMRRGFIGGLPFTPYTNGPVPNRQRVEKTLLRLSPRYLEIFKRQSSRDLLDGVPGARRDFLAEGLLDE